MYDAPVFVSITHALTVGSPDVLRLVKELGIDVLIFMIRLNLSVAPFLKVFMIGGVA